MGHALGGSSIPCSCDAFRETAECCVRLQLCERLQALRMVHLGVVLRLSLAWNITADAA